LFMAVAFAFIIGLFCFPIFLVWCAVFKPKNKKS
jgi:hypothetical protein